MQSDIKNTRFILSSESLPYKQLFELIAKHLSVPPPSIKASSKMTEIGWRFEKIYSALKGRRPYITKESSRIASKNYFYSNDKIKQELKFEFMPVNEVISDICNEYIKYIS
jgi:hypothetical protein